MHFIQARYAYTKQDSKCLQEITRNQIQWMKTGSDLELDAYVIKRFSDTTDLRASNLECPQFNVCSVTLPYWASFIQKKYPGYCLVGCPIPPWVSDIHFTSLKNGEQRVIHWH